jgi:hypothetical protein
LFRLQQALITQESGAEWSNPTLLVDNREGAKITKDVEAPSKLRVEESDYIHTS